MLIILRVCWLNSIQATFVKARAIKKQPRLLPRSVCLSGRCSSLFPFPSFAHVHLYLPFHFPSYSPHFCNWIPLLPFPYPKFSFVWEWGSAVSAWVALGGLQGPPTCPRLPPLVRIMTLGALQGFSIFFVKSN